MRCTPRHVRDANGSGPEDLPAYLTWTIRPVPGGCTIRHPLLEPR
jgi:hypothetical protein